MKIIKSILEKNSCYTQEGYMQVKGLMLHSIGCPQPRAEVFARGWNVPNKWVCTHGFIDGLTGDVWQFLPWNHIGWHAGGTANSTHIGVEMGEPDCIKYKPSSATFTIKESDRAAAIEVVKRTYASAVNLFAYLCTEYKLDPLADGVIISHREGHQRGVASNHGDPEHIWTQLHLPFTMDTFRADVKKAMDGEKIETDEQPADYIVYKVKRGETLSSIAAKYNLTWYELAKYNGIENPDYIIAGQLLRVPTEKSRKYTVAKGDSLWKIAKEYYGSGWKYPEIVRANGMTKAAINPGDVLIIPNI